MSSVLAPRSAAIRVSATFTLVVFSTDMNMPMTITASGRPHPPPLVRGADGTGGDERRAGAPGRVGAATGPPFRRGHLPNECSATYRTVVRQLPGGRPTPAHRRAGWRHEQPGRPDDPHPQPVGGGRAAAHRDPLGGGPAPLRARRRGER